MRCSHKVFQSVALVAMVAWSQSPLATPREEYKPTLNSLNRHPLPEWYAGAKLGIFVHWGLYSVPGWAPLQHPNHDFASQDYIRNNPYAEWYFNVMRIPGSPTQAYHREHYGNADYYDFARTFNEQSQKWSPDAWARIFRDAGARYVVLTTKHHDGFALWPSNIQNPNQAGLHATRDIVGELTKSVKGAGMKMGLYYSGGYDWTFNRGPIEKENDYDVVKPQTFAYGSYADAQAEELINRYHPAVFWNDIDWPQSGNALKVIADYYNAVPEGVVNDRFGIKHADFTTPEYAKLSTISEKKWEECRGLGRSFGYNRAEGENETIAPADLIALLVDVVSKNGNLLLDVGPMADGTIPPVQMDRLQKLGAWLKQNGDAIYDTEPWVRAEARTADGIGVRFTRKGKILNAIFLDRPKDKNVVLEDIPIRAGSQIHLLGNPSSLSWKREGRGISIRMPDSIPGSYAFVLQLELDT